jgi:hypothetical protein
MRHELVVSHTWDGAPIPEHEQTRIGYTRVGDELVVDVLAPFHADPPPAPLPGRLDRLWEHEAVELFLLAEPARYLELELGPHGHYLGLLLHGRRCVARADLPVRFESERDGDRWRGLARMRLCDLPAGVCRGNAYAIHGRSDRRRYLACFPVPGPAPDFHRLECFGPLLID